MYLFKTPPVQSPSSVNHYCKGENLDVPNASQKYLNEECQYWYPNELFNDYQNYEDKNEIFGSRIVGATKDIEHHPDETWYPTNQFYY